MGALKRNANGLWCAAAAMAQLPSTPLLKSWD